MRILSLLPSATEIVCALGLRDQLVGVTHECDDPPDVRNLPHVTRTRIPSAADSGEIDRLVRAERHAQQALYSLDFDAAARLRPDLLITQTLCDVCAVDDREVREFQRRCAPTGQPEPRVVLLEPTDLRGVEATFQQVADAAGKPEAGRSLRQAFRSRLDTVAAAARAGIEARGAAYAARPSVVVLEWLDPFFTSGHWTPELVELAGGHEPIARAGSRSRVMSEQKLRAADPDVLVVACCGFAIERTMSEIDAFRARPAIAGLRAVRERRTFVVDGSAYFSRPGPRLADSAEILAECLWPGRLPLRSETTPPLRL